MLRPETAALWAVYAVATAGAIFLARRFAGNVSRRAAILIALLPLVFAGKAMVFGLLDGPADLYAAFPPWRATAPSVTPVNPILSDLAFANVPWRAAVRDALVNGRFPFWNRFVLAGNPLLAAAQAGIFHPATWLGILLPLPLSWTFSCAFTLFLALLSAFLYFRDFDLSEPAAMLGAVGWGFSTYIVFWAGWSVGPSTATFPLLLLGLRRIVRGGRSSIGLTAAGILLSVAGGHPESLLHCVGAAGVLFLADLFGFAREGRGTFRGRATALRRAVAAGALAFLLSGPQLFPLLEAIPHTAEYRERRARLDRGAAAVSQSVSFRASLSRMGPAVLPFAHGIYGQSPVAQTQDGSGMPLAYAGAMLFPFALLGLFERRKGRAAFAGLAVAGILLGASAPGLIDVLTRLPGFALALNYRLVFLAPLGLAGLAAFGADAVRRPEGPRRLTLAAFATVAAVGAAAALVAAAGVFRDRGLPIDFVARSLVAELAPLLLVATLAAIAALAATAAARTGTGNGRRAMSRFLLPAAIVFLCAGRGLELPGIHSAQDGSRLAPPSEALAIVRASGFSGARIAAEGSDLRPNGSALYGVEDVRGYESIVLDRFADTYPLWCVAQPASFNRVDDLTRPFLSFLGARFAAADPGAAPPAGWTARYRGADLALFENPRALARAFVPEFVTGETGPRSTLRAMAAASDFSRLAWVRGMPAGREIPNPAPARMAIRTDGSDLVIDAESAAPFFAMTSIPDWPGWRARENGRGLPLATADHAFFGVWLPAGRHHVRLTYRPPAWAAGLGAFAAGLAGIGFAAGRRKWAGRPRPT